MADNFSRYFRRKAAPTPTPPPAEDPDRLPTNEELLHELRLHGAKAPRRKDLPAVSRRTRDYLLLAGIGSAIIVVAIVKVLASSETESVVRLSFTGVTAYCGLLWYIFYGVMSRY
ncbi:MAG TPA: hypothetical protein VM029_05875 [Opitutaceae bacterium]|nr:hypothetical protein [Opitutaceae bacterium]